MLAGILTDFGSPTRRGAVRRPRRVRRRDDRSVPSAARRRAVHAAKICAPGTPLWGAGAAPHRHREQLRHGHRRRRSGTAIRKSAPTGCSRSATRGADGGEEIDARIPRDAPRPRRPAPRLRDRRLSGVGPAVRRIPSDRAVRSGRSASASMTIDDGVAYGEPFEKGTAVAALRRRWRPPRRRSRSPRAPGTIDRSGVRRMGLAPIRSMPTGGGSRREQIAAFDYPAIAAVRRHRVHRRRQRHVRDSALRRQVPHQRSGGRRASRSARSPATLALRGQRVERRDRRGFAAARR